MGVRVHQAGHHKEFLPILDLGIFHRSNRLWRASREHLLPLQQHHPRSGSPTSGVNYATSADHAAIVDKFSTGSAHVAQMLQPAAPSIDTLASPRLALANDAA